MEKSKICSDEMMVQLSPCQMKTDEIEKVIETVVKQEIQEDLEGDMEVKVSILKEEAVDFNDTQQYFDNRLHRSGADIKNEHEESSVHCKEECFDIKYEDLRAEVTGQPTEWIHNGEREIRDKKLHEGEESSNNLKAEELGIVRDRFEVDLYKCLQCSYAAKQAGNLKRHMLVHKSKSEVRLYQCHECSYSAKQARDLKRHMLVHKSKSEVRLYECQECSYTTKHSIRDIKRHILIHESKSKVDLYMCQECLYSTKYARCFKKHMLVHEDEF